MFTLKNTLLTLGLATCFSLLIVTIIDPLAGNCSRFEARVISSNADSSTISLPDGRVAVIEHGNLKPETEIKVGEKSRLISGIKEYKFKAVISKDNLL